MGDSWFMGLSEAFGGGGGGGGSGGGDRTNKSEAKSSIDSNFFGGTGAFTANTGGGAPSTPKNTFLIAGAALALVGVTWLIAKSF